MLFQIENTNWVFINMTIEVNMECRFYWDVISVHFCDVTGERFDILRHHHHHWLERWSWCSTHIDKAKPQLHPIQGLAWTCQIQLAQRRAAFHSETPRTIIKKRFLIEESLQFIYKGGLEYIYWILVHNGMSFTLDVINQWLQPVQFSSLVPPSTLICTYAGIQGVGFFKTCKS